MLMHKITSLSPTNPHLAHCSILPLSSFNPPPHLRHVDDASLKAEEFYFVKYNIIKYRKKNQLSTH
ncbi:MAG: hypothetical protein QXD76_03850 [Sulfolobales archaeon]